MVESPRAGLLEEPTNWSKGTSPRSVLGGHSKQPSVGTVYGSPRAAFVGQHSKQTSVASSLYEDVVLHLDHHESH